MAEQSNQTPIGGEPAPATAPAGDAVQNQQEAAQQPTGFTQEQVKGLVAKESKKAKENLLAELGFEGEGPAKERIAQFKKWIDSQKTEAQLAAERAEQEAKRAAELEQEVARRDKQIAALGKGVPAEKAQQYITLADSYAVDGVDFAEGLEKALSDFPIDPQPTTLQSLGAKTNSPNPPMEDEFTQKLNKYRRS